MEGPRKLTLEEYFKKQNKAKEERLTAIPKVVLKFKSRGGRRHNLIEEKKNVQKILKRTQGKIGANFFSTNLAASQAINSINRELKAKPEHRSEVVWTLIEYAKELADGKLVEQREEGRDHLQQPSE